MREIKFRMWDAKEKIMIYDFSDEICWYFPPKETSDVPLLSCEMMQFTGLRDKTGKKIYEGDIVFYPSTTGGYSSVVQYRTDNSDGGVNFCGYDIWNNPEREVIGNIYENPELVKEESK